MKEYIIIFDKSDQNLIDITCLYPEPVEAFAFVPVQDRKMKASTVDKKRFELWIKTLKEANKEFEIIDA
jgi:hypothetical protein